MPRWLIVTLLVLGFCLIPIFGIAIIARISHEGAAQVSGPRIVDRDRFKSAVFQQGPWGVIAGVGKPDRTITLGHHEVWYYDGRIRDPISGHLGNARIRMALGRICDEVDFD